MMLDDAMAEMVVPSMEKATISMGAANTALTVTRTGVRDAVKQRERPGGGEGEGGKHQTEHVAYADGEVGRPRLVHAVEPHLGVVGINEEVDAAACEDEHDDAQRQHSPLDGGTLGLGRWRGDWMLE